jgi:hypothetical protein
MPYLLVSMVADLASGRSTVAVPSGPVTPTFSPSTRTGAPATALSPAVTSTETVPSGSGTEPVSTVSSSSGIVRAVLPEMEPRSTAIETFPGSAGNVICARPASSVVVTCSPSTNTAACGIATPSTVAVTVTVDSGKTSPLTVTVAPVSIG